MRKGALPALLGLGRDPQRADPHPPIRSRSLDREYRVVNMAKMPVVDALRNAARNACDENLSRVISVLCKHFRKLRAILQRR